MKLIRSIKYLERAITTLIPPNKETELRKLTERTVLKPDLESDE